MGSFVVNGSIVTGMIVVVGAGVVVVLNTLYGIALVLSTKGVLM